MNKSLLIVLAIAAVAAVARSAHAAPVVLSGPGLDSAEAESIAKKTLGTDALQVAGSLADHIGSKGTTAAAVGAASTTCTQPAKRPLTGEFLVVDQQMAEMEYATVRVTIAKIVERVACYGVNATRDEIYTLFFTQGMAAFYDGDAGAAQTAFSQAASIDPSRPWPDQYPPTPKPLYDEALRVLTASTPVRVVSSVEGEVLVDGEKNYGKPMLYPGGHLIFVPESSTSLWVTIPRAPAMSEDGLLVASSAELLLGLMAGNAKYAPWLGDLAERQGWPEIALVGKDSVVVFREGAFFTPEGTRIQRDAGGLTRSAAPVNPATVAGIVLIGVGAGTGAAGAGLNVSSFNDGLPTIGSPLLPRADYERFKTQNTAGLALTVTGVGIAVAGAVVTVVSLAAPSKVALVVPWMSGDDTSVAVGLAGRIR